MIVARLSIITTLILAFLLVLPGIAHAQQQSPNFTNPNITVLYRLGRVFLSVQWNSTSFIYLTAKAYAGTSPICSQDTTFVTSQFGAPDYPPFPGASAQTNTPSQSVFHLNANTVEALPFPVYFCVYKHDSYSDTANTTAVLVDPSLIPAITTTASTTTASTSLASTTSASTSSSSYSTSVYPGYASQAQAGSSNQLTVPSMSVSYLKLPEGSRLNITATWSGGVPPYKASLVQSPSASFCGLSDFLFNTTVYSSSDPSLYYSFIAPSYGTEYYCVYVADSAGDSSASPVYTLNVTPGPTATAGGNASCGCICSGTCVKPANITTSTTTIRKPVSVSTTTYSTVTSTSTLSTTSTTTIPVSQIQISSILNYIVQRILHWL